MNEEAYIQKARTIIEKNVFMTIATATPEAEPWITPVFYSYDSVMNFYWYSAQTSKHSQLIAKNNKIAVTIFNSNADDDDAAGVYLTGKATEVIKDDLYEALEIYFTRAIPTDKSERYNMIHASEDFLDFSKLRMYKFIPERIYVSGEAEKWQGKWIDKRVEIKL